MTALSGETGTGHQTRGYGLLSTSALESAPEANYV